ncbi:MAG: ABC-2 type transport system ATP-binding protein [Natronomonas sp.]|jgi:ABC-2 type transport system ATP-binding protein
MESSGADPVIEVTGLRKEYGSTVAVDGISFDVRENEIFGLLGPNGAGKTVTVEMLQGLRTPTAGTATLLGLDVHEHPIELKDRIGVVPQSFHTFDRLTVRENIALIRDLHTGTNSVEEVIGHLGLDGYADKPFHALSGGYQRRTGIAMALVSGPEILFLDEPTTGLDPAARRETWNQIRRVTDLGTTVVLTTHYMDEIEYLADRVALLVDGRLEAVDSVSALIEEYAPSVKLVVRTENHTDDRIETTLAEAAQRTYRNETDDLVGVFDDRQAAQETFSKLHELGTVSTIDLVSAGMDDVFLELAGGTLGTSGELR